MRSLFRSDERGVAVDCSQGSDAPPPEQLDQFALRGSVHRRGSLCQECGSLVLTILPSSVGTLHRQANRSGRPEWSEPLSAENVLVAKLDLDKLAASQLTIKDVTRAVDSQDLGAKNGPPAGPGES